MLPLPKLLIVDDEEIDRRVLLARARGIAEVSMVDSAVSALLHLQTATVDVVLCDDHLGSGPSGQWLLAEVALRWPATRRCLMSATWASTRERFLLKPVLQADLVRLITGPAGTGGSRP